jgi:hypothetical protein
MTICQFPVSILPYRGRSPPSRRWSLVCLPHAASSATPPRRLNSGVARPARSCQRLRPAGRGIWRWPAPAVRACATMRRSPAGALRSGLRAGIDSARGPRRDRVPCRVDSASAAAAGRGSARRTASSRHKSRKCRKHPDREAASHVRRSTSYTSTGGGRWRRPIQ